MERLFVVIFILQACFAEHSLSEFQYEHLKLLSEVKNGHNLLEHFAEKTEALSLCEKHSNIYIQERNNFTGWAFRSKYLLTFILMTISTFMSVLLSVLLENCQFLF